MTCVPQSSSSSKDFQVGNQLVNNKYTILQILHEGVNSKIYVAAFNKNNRQVSRIIKTVSINISQQPIKNNNNTAKKGINFGIKNQVNVIKSIFVNEYGKLDMKTGLPHMFQYGAQGHHNYMVMDLYGPNLAQLMKLCGGKFSARTTLLISLQILDRLEDVHNKKFLYSGLCPENFLIGLNRESFLIYMVDFSRSTIYKSKSKSIHIPYQQTNLYESPIFDHIFSSVNSQLRIQMSRRDDIESFMYLILFLFKGRLPWTMLDNQKFASKFNVSFNKEQANNKKQNQPGSNNTLNYMNLNEMIQEQNAKILQIKRRATAETLFKSLSFELIDLMNYVKTLSFYQKPDYSYIRKKLWGALMETDYEQLRNNIIIYDWNQREPLDYQIYRDIPQLKLKSDRQKQEVTEGNSNQNKSNQIQKQTSVQKQRGQSLKSTRFGNTNESQNKIVKRVSMSNKMIKSTLKPNTSQFHPLNENNNNSQTQNKSSSSFKSSRSDLKNKKDEILQESSFDDANVVEQEQLSEQKKKRISQNKIKDQKKLDQSIFKQNKQSKRNTSLMIQQKLQIVQSMNESQFKGSRPIKDKVSEKQTKDKKSRKNSGSSETERLL